MKVYRGWKLERVRGAWNVGYDPQRKRTRKISGWLVHYPEGGSRWADTLQAAKDYIDRYLA